MYIILPSLADSRLTLLVFQDTIPQIVSSLVSDLHRFDVRILQ